MFMSDAPLPSPRKRKRPEQHQLLSPPSPKRQKAQYHRSVGYIDTPAFWNSLSKVWLTKHSLREFERRNALPPSDPPAHRPITRAFRAKQSSTQERPSALHFLSNDAPKRLRNIKNFARCGGPDLSHLIGCPEPSVCAMSSRRSTLYRKRSSPSKSATIRTRTDQTKTTKRSYPKDANFLQKLNDYNIYQYGYKGPNGNRPPQSDNWEEINQRLAKRRASLSPSVFPVGLYQTFVDKDAEADNEDEVKDSVLPVMLTAIGAIDGAQKNVWFNNFNLIAEGISQAKPDYYYGAHPKQLDQRVRNDEELSKYIIPSTTSSLPILPNFFLEAKGPHGSMAEALRQACHDGAVGARAMHSLRSYGEEQPVYDNNTYTISATYHSGGQLKLFGHAVAQPGGPGTDPEYYMRQLGAYSMTGDRDSFIKGATAFKNAVDMTKEHRDAAIARANEIAARTVEEESGDDDDDDQDGSETSMEEEYRSLPAKRPSSKSHRSRRSTTGPSEFSGRDGKRSSGARAKNRKGQRLMVVVVVILVVIGIALGRHRSQGNN